MPSETVASNDNIEATQDQSRTTKENFLALFTEFSRLRDKMRAMLDVDSKDMREAVKDDDLRTDLEEQSELVIDLMDRLITYFEHQHDGGNYTLGKFNFPTSFNDEVIIREYAEQLIVFAEAAKKLLEEKRNDVYSIIREGAMEQPLRGVLNRMPMMQRRINRELEKTELSKKEVNSTSTGRSQSDHTDKEKKEEARKAKLEQKKQAKLEADRKKKEQKERKRREAEMAAARKKAAMGAESKVSEANTYSLETIQALSQRIEDSQEVFKKPIRFEIASEIILDMLDKLEAVTNGKPAENKCEEWGINFEELYALFEKGVDKENGWFRKPFQRELSKLRKELKPLGIWLKGSLHADVKEPKPILLEWIQKDS